MNASVTVWRDGIIIHSLRFETVAEAKAFATTYNRSADPVLRSRALLTY